MEEFNASGVDRIYQPINAATREIRLLKIHPGNHDATVQCSAHVFPLDEAPKYMALSYVWGDANITSDIIVNDVVFAATVNLVSALQVLRLQLSHYYWVDAICINQTDRQEREAQVLLMSSIYRQATRVIVWLGPSVDDSEYAIEMIYMLCSRRWQESDLVNLEWLQNIDRIWIREYEEQPFNRYWSSLQKLFERAFWSRAWILQELILPVDVMFLCGKQLIPLGYIRILAEIWIIIFDRRLPIEWISPLSTIPHAGFWTWRKTMKFPTAFISLLRTKLDPPAFDLKDVTEVVQQGSYNATDRRDLIYSVLGLCSNTYGIVPDYSPQRSISALYCDFATRMVRHSRDLRHLQWLSFNIESRNQLLPSWVPDLAVRAYPFVTSPLEADAQRKGSHRISGNQRILWAQGIMVDRLAAFSGSKKDARDMHMRHTRLMLNYIHKTQKTPTGRWSLDMALRLLLWRKQPMNPTWQWTQGDLFRTCANFIRYAMVMFESDGFSPEETRDQISSLFFGPCTEESSISQLERLAGQAVTFDEVLQHYNSNEVTHQFEPSSQNNRDFMLDQVLYQRFYTQTGYLGLASGDCKEGDIVCILFGCSLPLLLREVDAYYILVGQCLIPEIMKGEAVTGLGNEQAHLQEFEIH